MKEWDDILQQIKEWAYEAGEEIVKSMDRPLTVKQKSADIDLVTEMDIWTEEFLKDKVRKNYPGHAMITEESGEHQGDSDYQWVIDPIDGTTNFAHSFPMFCISIAVKYKDETVIALVHAPKLHETFTAIKGQGAYINDKPITVSKIERLTKAVVATGFPYDRATDPVNNVEEFNKVVLKVGGIRRTGSAAIDLCMVASGRFEAYWEYKINPWDFEAGLLLVKEAGGKVYVEKKEKGFFVLVGNESIYNELESLLEIN